MSRYFGGLCTLLDALRGTAVEDDPLAERLE
jgi:hypothetical protein